MKVNLSQRAVRDLRDILRAIARENVSAAKALDDRFTTRFHQLSSFPHLGRIRSDIALDVRGLRIGPYVAFYVVEPDDVTILRVLHTGRNLPEAFL